MKPRSKGCAVFLVVAAVAGAALSAAAYHYRPKLIARAQAQVDEFLRKEGLFLDYELHTGRLDGAVTLRNIVAYENGTKQKRVAGLDRLVIRIGLRSLFVDHVLRTHLAARDATFTVFGDEKTGNPAFENLDLNFDCRPGSVVIDHLRTRFQGIELRAGGEVRIESGSAPRPTPTPLDFSPILQLAPALDYRQAAWTPVVEATLTGTHSTQRDSTWEARLQSDSFPSKGVNLGFQGRVVTAKNGNLTIDNARLEHSSGKASLAGTIAENSDTLALSQFDSTIDWVAVLRDHPALGGAWKPLAITQPPPIKGSGSLHLETADLSKLTFTVGNFAMRFQPENQKAVSVPQASAQGSLDKGVLRLNPIAASLAKGSASGELTYTPFAEIPGWGANLKGTHLYLPDLLAPQDGKQLIGYVDFTFTGQGTDKPEALQGQGRFSVKNGDFFHTRVFGPLLLFLHKMSNNPEKGNPQTLSASFQIQNGVVRTSDVVLDISEAHVKAAGTIDLVKQTGRFDAQAKLRGPLGIAVDLIGEGPLDKMEWRKK